MIQNRFKSEIESEFEDRVVRKAIQKTNDENKLDIISIKEIRDQSHNTDGTYSATIELVIAPEFELSEYKKKLTTLGKLVEYSEGRGWARDVDIDGSLIIETPEGELINLTSPLITEVN